VRSTTDRPRDAIAAGGPATCRGSEHRSRTSLRTTDPATGEYRQDLAPGRRSVRRCAGSAQEAFLSSRRWPVTDRTEVVSRAANLMDA